MNLQAKRVLITGGSSGIGYAVAEALLAKGAKLVITGRRADVLHQAKERLQPSGPIDAVAREMSVIVMPGWLLDPINAFMIQGQGTLHRIREGQRLIEIHHETRGSRQPFPHCPNRSKVIGEVAAPQPKLDGHKAALQKAPRLRWLPLRET